MPENLYFDQKMWRCGQAKARYAEGCTGRFVNFCTNDVRRREIINTRCNWDNNMALNRIHPFLPFSIYTIFVSMVQFLLRNVGYYFKCVP